MYEITKVRAASAAGVLRAGRALKRLSSSRFRSRLSPQMTNRKLKFGSGILAVLTIGFGGPIGAVMYQQKKARG
jgi:hypothetical protein